MLRQRTIFLQFKFVQFKDPRPEMGSKRRSCFIAEKT